ncbi:MAG: hypothetical protein ACJ8DO_00040, partial [Microvirga sp.]
SAHPRQAEDARRAQGGARGGAEVGGGVNLRAVIAGRAEGPNPEPITTVAAEKGTMIQLRPEAVVFMGSGLALRAPRNDMAEE